MSLLAIKSAQNRAENGQIGTFSLVITSLFDLMFVCVLTTRLYLHIQAGPIK